MDLSGSSIDVKLKERKKERLSGPGLCGVKLPSHTFAPENRQLFTYA